MEIGIAIVVFILVLVVVAIASRKNRSTQESTPLTSEIAAEEKVAVQSQSKSSAGSDPNLFPDLEEGIEREVVQKRLGHASIVVTSDIYSHVTRRLQRKAADAFEEILVNE